MELYISSEQQYMSNQKIFSKSILYIFGFLYIFNITNFFPINIAYILMLITFVVIFFNFKLFIKIISIKRIMILNIFIIYISCYLLLSYNLDNSDQLSRVNVFIVLLVSIFNAITFVIMYIKIYGNNFDKIYNILQIFLYVQIFFIILAVVSSDFREWTLLSNLDKSLYSISNDYGSLRSYGLANGYTAAFPAFLGISILFLLFFIINKKNTFTKIKNTLLIFILLFSIIINARIGLSPFIIFIFLYPLIFIINFKTKVNIIYFFYIYFMILVVVAIVMLFYNSIYFERLLIAFDEISFLINGDKVGTFYVLEKMFFLPNNLIFGDGIETFGSIEKSSDIGFIRDINMFGVFNLSLLVLVLIYISIPLIKILINEFGKIFILIFFLSLLIFYFKGIIFSANELTHFLLIVIILSNVINNKRKFYEKNISN